jgi:hypothetical protein
VLVACVVACSSAPPPAHEPIENHAGSAVIEPSTALEVTLDRSACFIVCPVYTVTIHSDGTVDWVGMDHVQVVGKAHGHVDRGGLQQLEVAIDASRFFERDKRGRLQPPAQTWVCTDLSTIVITVTRGANAHTVEDDQCHSDPDLTALEHVIDAIANTPQWIGPML